ncbi:MAG: alpha/beta hydrolase-fold protein, partial [Chitinophagales bacterium]
MNKLLILLTGIFMLQIAETNAQLPNVASGKIERYADFKSAVIETRNVDVWLPADYSSSKKYAVLYMHDGQMLFDSAATWNKQEWHVDETVSNLIAEGKIIDCIVVGIWNNGIYRHADYFPQKPLADLPSAARDTLIKNELQGQPRSDAYLQFIVSELKPF